MTEQKILVFDMDGTIADLYGVENWLSLLRAENPLPYEIAKPLYDMDELAQILLQLKSKNYFIVVTSWGSLNATPEYMAKIRQAKKDWLYKYDFPFDEIHIVKYGTTKANCTRKYGGYQILFDDNQKIRKGWNLGATVDANENIIEYLKELL